MELAVSAEFFSEKQFSQRLLNRQLVKWLRRHKTCESVQAMRGFFACEEERV